MYDKAKIEEIKALRREKGNAARKQALDELTSACLDSSHSMDPKEDSGCEKTNFSLQEEETLGHYDEDGYFIYNDGTNKEHGTQKNLIHASKTSRKDMKHKLGIDDVDSFIENKKRPNKMMRSNVDEEQEYSDDEDAPETLKDPWIDGLDRDERAHFKSAEQQKKLLNAKEQEKRKVEDRLENRFGTNMTSEEKLRTLIDLMKENGAKTPAHLIIRIKERGVQEVEDESMLTEKERLTKKKTFQKSVQLKPEALKKLNDVTELCDELTLDGYQIYDEPVTALEHFLGTE